MALNENPKTFVIHVVSSSLDSNLNHPDQEAQITFLIVKEFKILDKYSDFTDIFLKEKMMALLEQTKLNKHAIKLKNAQQLSYKPIHSLKLVELKTLKTNIRIHLKIDFI